MKYIQPLDQANDANAPYTNGNPIAGINGSIVPAKAIEYPQRELVNLITQTGLQPDNTNLTQIVDSLKQVDVCNVFKTAENTGNARVWGAVIPALPFGLVKGTAFWFKPGMDSLDGGTTMEFNGEGPFEVRHMDYSQIGIGDIPYHAWLLLFFDGDYFLVTVSRLVIKATETNPGGPEYLNAVPLTKPKGKAGITAPQTLAFPVFSAVLKTLQHSTC